MNTAAILHDFTHNPPGVFPKKALTEAMQHPEEISPELIRILQKGADDIMRLANTPDDNGFLYSMFLLAQFEEEKGLQPLIDFFSSDSMTAIRLTGDVVTENLSKLFAGMARTDATPLKKLIEDPQGNGFVRAAAIEALLCLVAWGDAELETIEDYFLELLSDKLEKEPSHVWNYLADGASRLGSSRCEAALQQAYAANLASEFYIPWDEAQRRLHRAPTESLRDLQEDTGLAPITSVIEEMQGWACFTPSAERITPIKIPKPIKPTRVETKIGRNDPCPCGSGRKFKKCCMQHQAETR